MKRIIVSLLVASMAYVGMLQCTGSFALTRKWQGFIRSFGNKWIQEIVFIIPGIFVFGVTTLIDAWILNSIEFWTGSNLVEYDDKDEHMKVVNNGDERMETIYRNRGMEMEVRFYKKNVLMKTLLMKKAEPGVIYALRDGEWKKVSAEEMDVENGKRVRVLEGNNVISNRLYTSDEYAALKVKFALKKRALLAGTPATTGTL